MADGGVIVLREIATRLGLAEAITGPLADERDPLRIQHSYAEMALARMLGIAAGYEDCDDIDALRSDPAMKIAVGRTLETTPLEIAITSHAHPTLSEALMEAALAALGRARNI